MCGIVGYIGDENATGIVIEGLNNNQKETGRNRRLGKTYSR